MVFPAKAFGFARIPERTNERRGTPPENRKASQKEWKRFKKQCGKVDACDIHKIVSSALSPRSDYEFSESDSLFTPMFSRHLSKSFQAFSLIELLVVVAIIAVLATLIVPAALRVLESGSKATCLGNMRTLSAGLLQYAADNNNTFPGWGWAYNDPSYAMPPDRSSPPSPFKPRQPGHGDVRCGLLMRGGYVTSESAFLCPVKRDIKALGYKPWGYTGSYAGCTYALNGNPGALFANSMNRDFPLSALRTPAASTVMLLEESWKIGRYDNDLALFNYSDPDYIDSLGTTFHANVGNVVFFDGSARSMTWKEWRDNAYDGGEEKARQFFGGLIGD
jgi:prepilin-type N-terminal cleavage/methylation domain-containing protein/prepilin-type processing-associated H-X9-DG protein